jgi:hypothetical protein
MNRSLVGVDIVDVHLTGWTGRVPPFGAGPVKSPISMMVMTVIIVVFIIAMRVIRRRSS